MCVNFKTDVVMYFEKAYATKEKNNDYEGIMLLLKQINEVLYADYKPNVRYGELKQLRNKIEKDIISSLESLQEFYDDNIDHI